MQLLDSKGNVLYKQEQSELLHKYSSMLKDAILNGVDFTDLCFQNQNLESFVFREQI